MTLPVVFAPAALRQLAELSEWIARESGYPSRADGYVSALVDFCERIGDFPNLGRSRDDVRPGLRTLGFRRRVVVAFVAESDAVTILGVFYGGQDHERLLR